MTHVLDKYEAIIDIKQNDQPVIFLFHGTGADNMDLIPIAKHLDTDSSLISINGNVFVNGARRYFDRNEHGVDLNDLKNRSLELAEFLQAVIEKENITHRKKVAIGYSNGANIIIGMLQTSSKLFDGAGLLHGAPYLALPFQEVKGLNVYVSLGENDQMINPADTMKMVQQFDEGDANVTVFSHQEGHRLTTQEVDALKSWYEGIHKV